VTNSNVPVSEIMGKEKEKRTRLGLVRAQQYEVVGFINVLIIPVKTNKLLEDPLKQLTTQVGADLGSRERGRCTVIDGVF